MSSRRPFVLNTDFLDYSSLYKRKNAMSNYQFARSHSPQQNYNNNLFLFRNINYHKNIFYYKSYDTLIQLSSLAASLHPSSSPPPTPDVPLILSHAFHSFLQPQSLLYQHSVTTDGEDPCQCSKCLKIPLIDPCAEKKGKLYPYGKFNNPIKNPAIQIHSLQNIDNKCEEKLKYDLYIMCKCSPLIENCECCNVTTITPFDDETNITYTENNYEDSHNHDEEHHHVGDEEPHRDNYNNGSNGCLEEILPFQKEHIQQLQEIKYQKLQEDKALSKTAVNVYSKYGSPNANYFKY